MSWDSSRGVNKRHDWQLFFPPKKNEKNYPNITIVLLVDEFVLLMDSLCVYEL